MTERSSYSLPIEMFLGNTNMYLKVWKNVEYRLKQTTFHVSTVRSVIFIFDYSSWWHTQSNLPVTFSKN